MDLSLTDLLSSLSDVERAAHYAMLRFGVTPSSSALDEAEGVGDQSDRGNVEPESGNVPPAVLPSGLRSKTAAVATAGAAPELRDFAIAALRPDSGGGPAAAGGNDVAGAAGSTNGQRLAATIRAQTEAQGLDAAVAHLVALHQGLLSQQGAILEAQAALAAQQAQLLKACGVDASAFTASTAAMAAGSTASGPGPPPRAGSLRERWSPGAERATSWGSREAAPLLRQPDSGLGRADSIRAGSCSPRGTGCG